MLLGYHPGRHQQWKQLIGHASQMFATSELYQQRHFHHPFSAFLQLRMFHWILLFFQLF